MKRFLMALVAVLLLPALAGCGLADRAIEKATENLIEQATGISVDTDEGSVTIRGEDGEQVTISGTSEEGGLVKGFPLPVHERLTVKDSGRLSANGKATYSASFSFAGDGTEVADYYEQLLKDRGLEVNRSDLEIDDEFLIYMAGESDTHTAMISLEWNGETNEGTMGILYGDK